jgi:hypothetical protein
VTIIDCRFCGGEYDREAEIDSDDHAADCPHVTGLFPVIADDPHRPMRCMACQAPFKPGDFYVKRPLNEREAKESPFADTVGIDVLTAFNNRCTVCVGCGVDLDAVGA